MNPIKIFIVEDEMIIAANISLQLTNLGYHIVGMASKGEVALLKIKENLPDIVLLDIQLKGELDGIETAKLLQKEHDIPIIYLTANVDEAHFNRAKDTHPYAYISKPFKKLDLQHAIELTIDLVNQRNYSNYAPSLILEDCIFVRHQEKMTKISIKDIYYIEAERNYCRIFSKTKAYLLVMTLKEIGEKLPKAHFIRIHRSFIVNLSQIDEVGSSHVVISRKTIPLSKLFKSKLLNRLQTI